MPAATDPPEPLADGTSAEPARPAARPGPVGRLMRAGATSAVATLLSHGSYVALLAGAHANATIASAIAFVLGACVNYFMGRRITWGRKRRPHPVRETLPYILVIAASGAVAIGVATLVQHLIGPLGLTTAARTTLLEIANIASYGLVFVFKFALLDRLVFRHHSE